MARGKHAASATSRKLHQAEEHIERLTEQLVRYKGFEADSRELVQAKAEIARLRQQIETDSAPRVHELEDRMVALRVERDMALEHATKVQVRWNEIMDKMVDRFYGQGPEATNAFFQEIVGIGFSTSEAELARLNTMSVPGQNAILRVRRQINTQMSDRREEAVAYLAELRAKKMAGEIPAEYDQLIFGLDLPGEEPADG